MRSRNRHLSAVAVLALGTATLPGQAVAAQDEEDTAAVQPDAAVQIDPRRQEGRDIPTHFVGLSIEWTLIERYMGPNARRGFANLLSNLDSGVLRIGGGSQDFFPFNADATNTNLVITPEDVAAVRSTLDMTHGDAAKPGWATILGTGTAQQPQRPFATPDNAKRFTAQGVEPSFGDEAGRRMLAGIELGNEPDLSWPVAIPGNVTNYLNAFGAYSQPDITGDFPVLGPNTSEQIAPWQAMKAGNPLLGIRYFHHWPSILDFEAPIMKQKAGSFPVSANDHYYTFARACGNDPYRCATFERLFSDQRRDDFGYQVYTHASQAAERGVDYRVEETSTAAGRGFEGVSNTAASATWALDHMFSAACPQPPDNPGANARCDVGAAGLNLHNAERNVFERPQDGNAWYNAVNYDPRPNAADAESPTPGPGYYAMLFFAELAQGTSDLLPVEVNAAGPNGAMVKAWQVRGERSERRLFLINKSQGPVTVDVEAPESKLEVSRMTPHDPTGAGRTLDALDVRIDGQAIAADGSWPGLQPTEVETHGRHAPIAIGTGEAVVVTMHGHEE
jgi:hypothetical protein